MKRLELTIPKLEELDFYQQVLSDSDSMSYNAPWFPPHGCIDFPESKWKDQYERWFNQEPERFFAYLKDIKQNHYVGYVHYRFEPGEKAWEIGVIIYAPQRGKGYGREGLTLLIEKAFREEAIDALYNTFEKSREEAYHLHQSLGFKDLGEEDGIRKLVLTREEYLKNRS